MRNEIIENMKNEEYHRHDGISNTAMGYLLDCPARYEWEYLNPNKPKKETPKHYKIGTALHTAVLEPHLFKDTYCTIPKINRQSNAGKAAYAEAIKATEGKIILDEEELSQVMGMAEAMKKHKLYQKIANGGKVENSFFWQDLEYGVQLKSRPDWHDGQMYIDVKTTKDIPNFHKSVYQYGYHRQAAVAKEAFKQLYNIEYKYFLYLVVEESAPYLTQAFILDDASLEKGHDDFRKAVKIYAECLENGQFPGYDEKISQITLPQWLNK